jgi:protein SCO1/2
MKRIDAAWITTIVLALSAFGARAAPQGSPWNGDYFPNVVLTDQDGTRLRFYDDLVKDKVVLINFMFATCHDACPLETAKLRQVQERLAGRVGRDMFMYSITITPSHDTPEVLKEYAAKFNVGPGWKFLTGNEDDITLLRKKLGLYSEVTVEQAEGHGMSLIVGNERTGVWMKRSSFDNPRVLARVMSDRLLNYASRVADDTSYVQAAHKIAIDPGEDLFRRRCQDCHTVGAGDAIGPDLEGVTDRRERAWLARYIRSPNEVLAAKDPVATALYAKYRRVPMPTLGLTERDVEHLIGYLESQNAKLRSVSGAADSHADGHAHPGAH